MVFQTYFHGIPVEFLLDLHEAFMGFLRDLCDSPGKFIWDSYRNSMLFLLDFYDTSMGLLWGYYGGSIRFLWDFHCMSIVYDVSMGLLLEVPWWFFGICIRISQRCPMGFL